MRRALVFTFATLLTMTPGLDAQSGTQEGEVRRAIERVFEGMAAADSGAVRSGFAEGARFALVREGEGGAELVYSSIDGWLRAIAGSEGRWEERIFDEIVLIDGNVASAWVPYTFLLDGRVRHCGVNSIELLRTEKGWKITQLSDTRRMEGCAPGDGPDDGQPSGGAELREMFAYYVRDGGVWRQHAGGGEGSDEGPAAYVKRYRWGPGEAVVLDDTYAVLVDGTCT